ncbi:two-component system, chemotaxis family, sensor kinase CheA [Alkalispirochaeta americana]|uniref:Chemotaxis protein CheA n=1 Tax=Alkalispirochaeta americana TaxID=159291 RepID=A0A1N6PAE9_9SPIO|nr:chemotaxis protein CheA [Alkalispirochaeta americana]SIQ01350.1 two-component system, chemotaxis family, sensor kinase CheA [Alkalispirochaeta americana]
MSDYLDPTNEELLKDFFVEAEAQIEVLEGNILVLENDPSNSDSIDELFRAAHTLKGGAGTVQMNELAEFTHLVEDCLDIIREGKIRIQESTVDTLLIATDVIKAMLEERRHGKIYAEDVSKIEKALRDILSEAQSPGSASASSGSSTASADSAGTSQPEASSLQAPGVDPDALSEYELLELKEAAQGSDILYAVRIVFREDNPMNTVGGIHLFSVLKSFSTVLKTTPDFDALYQDMFHPVVTYYIATSVDPELHRKKLEISDVTEKVEFTEVSDSSASSGYQETAISAVSSAGWGALESDAPAQTAPISRQQGSEQKADTLPDSEDEALTLPGLADNGSDDPASSPDARKRQQSGSVLRVDSRRIDNLLNLVSETVINKAAFNQISNDFADNFSAFQEAEGQYRERLKELFDSLPDYLEQIQHGRVVKEVKSEINERFADLPSVFNEFQGDLKGSVAKFRNASQNLGRIAGELQEGVMRIRMVPISQIFSRFPRLVRDLSRSLKKKIDLQIEGEDTELDKSVIEDLLDPLIHCVRNSIDHGVEDPSSRRERGKDETGTVTLRASNEGNMILIEIVDDGRGIDVDAVRRKAIDRGIIHPSKQLSDVEAFNLIFDPGFSTAKSVTNVSGRGVGLDVVKRQIEKLNGTVTVWSEHGRGTRFTIKIPLTLAIIQGLLVRVGKEMYAIPITSVIDSHRIKPSEIKMIDNYEVFNVREDVVSLIRLSRLFRIPTNESPDYHYVVIVGTNERKMGLIVDSLIGEEDVVIKPLRDHFTNSPGIAGANITGDGKVSLIIDVSQLLELGLRREKEERAQRELKIGS